MAGYLGTKATFLSTTAGVVTGDMDVGGGLTVDGNVLVGKTTNDFTLEGAIVRSSGEAMFTRDGDTLTLNRLNTDGTHISLRKDDAVVGSIATTDGDIAVGTGGVGLRFGQNNSDQITPHSMSTNSGKNDAINLGASNNRFKDL